LQFPLVLYFLKNWFLFLKVYFDFFKYNNKNNKRTNWMCATYCIMQEELHFHHKQFDLRRHWPTSIDCNFFFFMHKRYIVSNLQRLSILSTLFKVLGFHIEIRWVMLTYNILWNACKKSEWNYFISVSLSGKNMLRFPHVQRIVCISRDSQRCWVWRLLVSKRIPFKNITNKYVTA